jgi:hypothetical protein
MAVLQHNLRARNMCNPSDRECRLISDDFKAAMLELERLPERPPVLDGDTKSREVESLDSALRLLRAYSKIKDQTVQRQLVSLMESIAANAG